MCDADGKFKASAIAGFVSANKLPLVTTLTQETSPSIFGNPIKKQACHVAYNWISFLHSNTVFSIYCSFTDNRLFCKSDFTICCCKRVLKISVHL